MRRNLRIVPGAALALLVGTALAGPTPAEKCESGKNKEAGKYAYCRQKAESKYAITGDAAARATAFQKCLTKYGIKWPGLEAKAVAAGGVCPSTGDQTAIQGFLDTATTNVATALAGGTLPDCAGDLLACQGDLGTCNGSLGDLTSCQGSLATTQASLTTCTGDLGDCTADLTTCQNDLTTCQAATTDLGQRLQTGQTTCYTDGGSVIPCAGTGQDGELQKGLVRAYTDNGDGTITDTKTGLMWEKLSDDGSIHDMDTTYTWTTARTTKVAALNGGGGFAGYTDWRMPNVNELQSIVDYGGANPAVPPVFNTGCAPACTVLTCSCEAGGSWSSSTYQLAPQNGWLVDAAGLVKGDAKSAPGYARAVRSSS